MRCGYLVLMMLLVAPCGAQAQGSGAPVTVQESIAATLRTHRGLKIIQENRGAMQQELQRAKAGWGPKVDLVGRVGADELSTSTTRSTGADKGMYSSSSVGATLVQPVWDGFATRSRVRSTQASLDSLTNRVFDNATTLALDSLIAHVDLLRLRNLLQLAQRNVARHQEVLAFSRTRETLGADTMADVSQAEGRLSRALSTLSDAQANLLKGEASYRRLTSSPTPASLVPVTLPAPMYTSPTKVLELAETNNPKIKAYLDDVRAAVGQKELAESAMYPTVNIEAGPNYADRGGPGSQWTRSMDVMGVVRWNVFSSGADAANTRAAAARVRQSRQTLYNLMDDLVLQTQTTWTNYQNAIELQKQYTQAITYNRQTVSAYLEQFQMGQRSLLDVLDAESELYNSATQATTAAGNILVGGYTLYALAGVLLETLDIDTANLDNVAFPDDVQPVMAR